jgi:hypothetical protein
MIVDDHPDVRYLMRAAVEDAPEDVEIVAARPARPAGPAGPAAGDSGGRAGPASTPAG